MTLALKRNISISNLQRTFAEQFPFIKIEFFSQPHAKGKPTSAKLMIPGNRTLAEIKSFAKEGELDVNPDMTVDQLEQTFENKFGLYVQVFRKSGRIWLETTATDEWTLSRQNQEGRELSDGPKEDGEIPDYHEQE